MRWVRFVPDQTGWQLDGDALCGFRLDGAQQGQLWVTRRKTQLLTLHDGFWNRRFGRGLLVEQGVGHQNNRCQSTHGGVALGGRVQ
jgi:hypothetical protein